MKAEKVMFVVEIGVLSIDSIPALLRELAYLIEAENTMGEIHKGDGDEIKWSYTTKPVEF